MYICVFCVCLVPTEKGSRVPRAGVKDICKLSCGSWAGSAARIASASNSGVCSPRDIIFLQDNHRMRV